MKENGLQIRINGPDQLCAGSLIQKKRDLLQFRDGRIKITEACEKTNPEREGVITRAAGRTR